MTAVRNYPHLAVFHDHGCHILDPLLKPGFRHCFVVCPDTDARHWISVDGRAGRPVVEVVGTLDNDMKMFYEGEGFTVVEVFDRGCSRLPLVLTNCVGIVKTILGTNAPWVLTPYQLYRMLRCT